MEIRATLEQGKIIYFIEDQTSVYKVIINSETPETLDLIYGENQTINLRADGKQIGNGIDKDKIKQILSEIAQFNRIYTFIGSLNLYWSITRLELNSN